MLEWIEICSNVLLSFTIQPFVHLFKFKFQRKKNQNVRIEIDGMFGARMHASMHFKYKLTCLCRSAPISFPNGCHIDSNWVNQTGSRCNKSMPNMNQ
ncbi:hypothetical protein DERP_004993 [Dermatophagoides pteronyssinus]|uniref:Uncharacterized protein n=1 Tax=Dermatophagoides pteronyssinus TaxID=6956 RepID=A0ABQ8JTJ9_DERPT|nr:hypothetical protein DERP_004993 [Dermatophagoides pteronyssinus]